MSRIQDYHTRSVIAFGVACDAALAVVVGTGSSALEQSMNMGWPLAIGCVIVVSVGLVVYAAALNDLLDRGRDAVHRGVESIIGSGPGTILLIGSLLLALFAASTIPGDAVRVALVLASLMLFHNAVARFIPAIGMLVPGAVIAGVMLVPNWRLQPSLVVWSVMTMMTLTSIVVHVRANKRPLLSFRACVAVLIGWCVISGVLLTLPGGGLRTVWPQAEVTGLAWPAIAWGITALFCWSSLRSGVESSDAGHNMIRIVGLWQPAIAAAWCQSLGMHTAAFIFLLVAAAGFIVAGGIRGFKAFGGGFPAWR